METPKTLLEAVTYFSDPDRAHAFAVKSRWPYGVACPTAGCGSANVLEIKSRRTWKCRECKRQFSVKVGTIFEASPLPLTKWLPAVWLLTNTKNGTSSCELARALGVTQKTAWFMFHRIRLAMGTPDYAEKLQQSVEVDETFVGGKARNRHSLPYASRPKRKSKGPHQGKTIVMGLIQRGGPVRAMTVTQTTSAQLLPRVRAAVEPGAVVYTDAHVGYIGLGRNYAHFVIDHSVEYVKGHIHTNSIENFWSCLKRTLGGTYISVQPFHLDAYLGEQVFRFNNRTDNDGGRFVKVLKATDGRRLTYAALTESHPLWRLKPGRASAGQRKRLARPQTSPTPGVSA